MLARPYHPHPRPIGNASRIERSLWSDGRPRPSRHAPSLVAEREPALSLSQRKAPAVERPGRRCNGIKCNRVN